MKTQKAFCLSVLINMSVTSKMSSLRNHKMAPFAQASSPLHCLKVDELELESQSNRIVVTSDVKFREIFALKYFMKYFKNFTMFFPALHSPV